MTTWHVVDRYFIGGIVHAQNGCNACGRGLLVDGAGLEMKVAFAGPERLDDVLRQADYLAVTLSLSSATRNLIDDRRLRLMKRTSYLVNVARAEIFDETALYDALASGRIAGAALDVWYRYPVSAESTPPALLPFHELGCVIMTPHISGWTEGMLDARATLIANNIERITRGELPINVIDPAT